MPAYSYPKKTEAEGAIQFTDAEVRRLIALGPGEYADSETACLRLRIQPNRRADLRWIYRIDGKQRVLQRRWTAEPRDLPSLREPQRSVSVAGMRKLVAIAAGKVAENLDPKPPRPEKPVAQGGHVAKPPRMIDSAERFDLERVLGEAPVRRGTVAHLVQDYWLLRGHECRSRQTASVLRRILALQSHARGAGPEPWRDVPAHLIRAWHVVAALETLPETARAGFRAYISGTWRLALSRRDPAYGPIEVNPAADVKVPAGAERIDLLIAEDLSPFWWACEKERPGVAAFFRFELLTGQRPWSETAMVKWSEVRGEWWHPSHTKTGKPQMVYLAEASRQILEEQRERTGDLLFVFPGPLSARHAPLTEKSGREAYRRLIGRAGIWQPELFGAHGLRRTMATGMVDYLDIEYPTVQACLGHQPESVLGKHYLVGRGARQRAWSSWAEFVMSKVNGGGDGENVAVH